MLPKYHILFNFLFVLILKLATDISNAYLGIIFLASFLIDFDHYLYYVFRKRDLDPENAHEWFIQKRQKYLSHKLEERRKIRTQILIFHGIEFWLILMALSFYSKIFLFILAGIALHMFEDLSESMSLREPAYTKLSQIMTIIKNKGKRDIYDE